MHILRIRFNTTEGRVSILKKSIKVIHTDAQKGEERCKNKPNMRNRLGSIKQSTICTFGVSEENKKRNESYISQNRVTIIQ